MVATHNDFPSDANHMTRQDLRRCCFISTHFILLWCRMLMYIKCLLHLQNVSGGIISINCSLHFDPAREDVSFGVGTICSKFYDSQVEKDKEQLANLSPTLPTAWIQCWPKIQCNTVHQNVVQCKRQYHALHRTDRLECITVQHSPKQQVSVGINWNVAQFTEMQNAWFAGMYYSAISSPTLPWLHPWRPILQISALQVTACAAMPCQAKGWSEVWCSAVH